MDNSDNNEENNVKFANLTFGINTNNGDWLNSSSAMMDFSYALPLNYDNTYIALGFQAAYNFSQLATDGYNVFHKQFDQYGPVGAAITTDPAQIGYTIQYFTGGAGLALFHNGEEKQWYVGWSARHLNQPVTETTFSETFRLPISYGIQLGYSTNISNRASLSGYANFNWQNKFREHVIGATYNLNLNDSSNIVLSFGASWKMSDALIPNIGFQITKNRLSFYYEINFPGTLPSTYKRSAFEFAHRRDF
jgi:hypothetical protein